MDENKLKILKDINYKINETCGNCEYGQFVLGDFGTCVRYNYSHLKHTDSIRSLSIVRDGCCTKHKIDSSYLTRIHAYREFLYDGV